MNMCHEMGIDTGVNLETLREASRKMAAFLARELPSHVLAVGTRQELFTQIRERDQAPEETT